MTNWEFPTGIEMLSELKIATLPNELTINTSNGCSKLSLYEGIIGRFLQQPSSNKTPIVTIKIIITQQMV